MSKRGADQQLTNLNYKDENTDEKISDYFQVASQQELAKRKIKPLRGKLPTVEKRESQAATTILNSIGTPFGAFGANQLASDSKILKSPMQVQPIANQTTPAETKEDGMLSKIKSLNTSFIDQIGSLYDQDSLVNLIPLCNDYIRYRTEILAPKKADPEEGKKIEPFPAPSMPSSFDFSKKNQDTKMTLPFTEKTSMTLTETKPITLQQKPVTEKVSPTPAPILAPPVPPPAASGFTFGGFGTNADSVALEKPKTTNFFNSASKPPDFNAPSKPNTETPFQSPFKPQENAFGVPKPTTPVITAETKKPAATPSTDFGMGTKLNSFGASATSEVNSPAVFKFESNFAKPSLDAKESVGNSPAKAPIAIVADTKPAASPFQFNLGSQFTNPEVKRAAPPVFNFGSTSSSSPKKETPSAPLFSFSSAPATAAAPDTKAGIAPFSFSSTGNSIGTGFASSMPSGGLAPFQFSKNENVAANNKEEEDEDSSIPPDQQVGEALMTGEGEENETTECSLKARIRVQSGQTWVAIGVGMLKINISKDDAKGRILLRADTNGRVLVNSRIYKGMSAAKKDAKMCATSLQIDGVLKPCLISVKTEKENDMLIEKIAKLAQ